MKDLRSGEQVEVPRDALVAWLLVATGRRGVGMMRTDRAGDLGVADIGRDVVVCGWVDSRRDHGGVVFLDIRDTAGIVQVVVDPGESRWRGRAPGAR